MVHLRPRERTGFSADRRVSGALPLRVSATAALSVLGLPVSSTVSAVVLDNQNCLGISAKRKFMGFIFLVPGELSMQKGGRGISNLAIRKQLTRYRCLGACLSYVHKGFLQGRDLQEKPMK